MAWVSFCLVLQIWLVLACCGDKLSRAGSSFIFPSSCSSPYSDLEIFFVFLFPFPFCRWMFSECMSRTVSTLPTFIAYSTHFSFRCDMLFSYCQGQCLPLSSYQMAIVYPLVHFCAVSFPQNQTVQPLLSSVIFILPYSNLYNFAYLGQLFVPGCQGEKQVGYTHCTLSLSQAITLFFR